VRGLAGLARRRKDSRSYLKTFIKHVWVVGDYDEPFLLAGCHSSCRYRERSGCTCSCDALKWGRPEQRVAWDAIERLSK